MQQGAKGMTMKTYEMKRKEKVRAAWMAEFQRRVVAAKPELAGRIDWNAATYYYNGGYTVDVAAAKFLATL